MNTKIKQPGTPSLSEESKQYVRENCEKIGKKQIQEKLKISHKTLTDFMNEEGLQGRYDKKGLSNFNVNKPESKPKKRTKAKNFDINEFAKFYK